MKIRLLSFLLAVFYCQISFSQNPIGPLSVGSQVPDVEMRILNEASETIQLSDFKGSAILLDFWATWCVPCVASFPKMDSLQKTFGKSLKIIPVTYEPQQLVEPFLARLNRIKNQRISSVVGDSILHSLFPHTSVPHYVWLDSNHVVKAITYSEDVTGENLEKLLKGSNLDLATKSDDSPAKAGTHGTPEVPNNIFFSRMLGKYAPGLPSVFTFSDSSLVVDNGSILNLYVLAYGEGLSLMGGYKHISLLTKDSSYFSDNSGPGFYSTEYRTQWIKEHGICYSIKVPMSESKRRWELMRNDLKQYFPKVNARFVNVPRKCLVLSTVGDYSRLLQSRTDSFHYNRSLYEILITNGSTQLLTNLLNMNFQNSYHAVINEANINEKISISLQADFSNIQKVNEALKMYGLRLDEQMRSVKILEINDLDNRQM